MTEMAAWYVLLFNDTEIELTEQWQGVPRPGDGTRMEIYESSDSGERHFLLLIVISHIARNRLFELRIYRKQCII